MLVSMHVYVCVCRALEAAFPAFDESLSVLLRVHKHAYVHVHACVHVALTHVKSRCACGA